MPLAEGYLSEAGTGLGEVPCILPKVKILWDLCSLAEEGGADPTGVKKI